ncbi:ParA family protein [Sphaerotilus montanus]|uniref:Chromosome partitioning protein n=1 Tax=Sphaerotilus montanus TaxID=522889 RepID=A0A7Y9U7T1_9BURK|nr:ParA family protein [Sphaerotilus montanus]NYG35488.1 chromosome partitioning protein [Sphaerotilus montanus]NZD58643.1 ParA family protein [Sphaerotilus montanus]
MSDDTIEFSDAIAQPGMGPPRGAIKLKLAMELSRWAGSAQSFRAFFPAPTKGEGSYHNVYTPLQIREARLRMMGIEQEPWRPIDLMPPIIYCRMAKGGVGKTTIAANIASCMAMQGHRVLMIDADPQASLTSMFGIDWTSEKIRHIGHALRDHEQGYPVIFDETIIRPIYPDGMLDLLASDITLANIESWLSTVMNREAVVERLFKAYVELWSAYDVIVIDSAPGSSQLSNALMYAAKRVLAVVMLDGQSIKAMEVLAHNIHELNRAYPDLKASVHLVANGFDARQTTCQASLEILRAAYPGMIDPCIIPRYASFARQVSLYSDAESGPILEREPNSPAAKAIIDLTRSLIGFFDVKLAEQIPVVPDSTRARRKG